MDEHSIPARFDTVAGQRPDALAVKTGDLALTFAELRARANGLAHAVLEAAGDRPRTVALLCEPGVARAIGTLACLKAGAACVPLEPGNPPERNVRILADAGATIVIAESGAGAVLPADVRRLAPLAAAARPHPPEPGPGQGAAALASILYTSGSTGAPKGVMYSHGMILERVVGHNRFAVGPGDRLTALGGGGMNLFRALLTGAALLAFDARRDGVAALAAWLRRERITLYHSVPTLFRHLVAALRPADAFPDLRIVSLTGEPVLRRDVEAFRRHFPAGAVLVHGLGTTEAGTFRELRIDGNTRLLGPVVPVGAAVEGTEVLLLDADGRPVPPGSIGEIAVQGEHLALGYWNRPDLTAERFRPAPGGGPGRLYRTGDLGRLLADGTLLHLGRTDFQVKVRGHRVEVGEVESALLDLPAVREAAVLGERDETGAVRLTAYVVPAPGAAPSAREIRGALQERLPDYMVPSAFTALDALPLTPNGKVDYPALPGAGGHPLGAPAGRDEPEHPLEAYLAALWSSVLPRPVTAMHDDFFALGGDSLLATRVVARLQEDLGIEAPLVLVFQHPTVAELAEALTPRTPAPGGP